MLRSSTLDQRLGAQVFFKCENFQRMGAFKFRGAFNALARFDAAQRRAGVLAFSSGNHAQAIALSARLQGLAAVILMPTDAPQAKVDATRGYGAEVVLFDRFTQDRDVLARDLARERGMTLVPPFDHPDVIAGQGTAAKELFEEIGELDYLFACVGGGGLLSGSALTARAVSPGCTVIGVEPQAGNDGQQSFRSGALVKIATPNTIADGAQTQSMSEMTLAIIRRDVNDMRTVSDAQLVDAMRFFAERMKIIVEPTGCLAAAAVMQGDLPLAGKRVGVIVSGGNVDLTRFGQLIG